MRELSDEELKKGLREATDRAVREIILGLKTEDFFKSFEVGGTAYDAYWYSYPPVLRGLVALRMVSEKLEVTAFAKNESELLKKLQSERQ